MFCSFAGLPIQSLGKRLYIIMTLLFLFFSLIIGAADHSICWTIDFISSSNWMIPWLLLLCLLVRIEGVWTRISLHCRGRSCRLGRCSLLFFVYATLIAFHQPKSFSRAGTRNMILFAVIVTFDICLIVFILDISALRFTILVTILFPRLCIHTWAVIIVIWGWWVCTTVRTGSIRFRLSCRARLPGRRIRRTTWIMSSILRITMFWAHWWVLVISIIFNLAGTSDFEWSLLRWRASHDLRHAIFTWSRNSCIRILGSCVRAICIITCAVRSLVISEGLSSLICFVLLLLTFRPHLTK